MDCKMNIIQFKLFEEIGFTDCTINGALVVKFSEHGDWHYVEIDNDCPDTGVWFVP